MEVKKQFWKSFMLRWRWSNKKEIIPNILMVENFQTFSWLWEIVLRIESYSMTYHSSLFRTFSLWLNQNEVSYITMSYCILFEILHHIKLNYIMTYHITSFPIKCNSIQFNAIQFNSIQFNSIQCNSIQCNSIQCNSILFYIIVLYPILLYSIQFN